MTTTPTPGSRFDRYNEGGSGTPTRTPTPKPQPTATPLAGSLNTDTELMIGLKSGQITYAQVAERYGAAKADQLQAMRPSPAQQATIDRIKAEIAAGTPPQQTVSPATNNGAPPGTDWGAVERAYAGESAERGAVSNAGTVTAQNNPAQGSTVGRNQTYGSGTARPGGGGGSSGGSRGGGGSAEPVPPPAPPPPPRDSMMDLANRGGLRLGNSVILNGQQYRDLNNVVQGQDGLWYAIDEAGNPTSTGFKTQAAAKALTTMSNMGPAIQSRTGVSPTARYAQTGGITPQLENPLFDTFSLDEIIASGATKGRNPGDILTTMTRAGYPNLDVLAGSGIPEYGGMGTVRDAMGNIQSFTGQVGNMSIGMSAPSAGDPVYLLTQQGLPETYARQIAAKGPEAVLTAQQGIDSLKSMGLFPDLTVLGGQYEPSMYQGSGIMKWGSANGGASNTPYDRALSAVKTYIEKPDLTYMDQMTPLDFQEMQGMDLQSLQAMGLDEIDLANLGMTYANGGQFWTDEPIYGIGAHTGQPKFLMGEAGPERVTIEPDEVVMGRDRGQYMGANSPMQQHATGANWGAGWWNPASYHDPAGNATAEGRRLGYTSQPLIREGHPVEFGGTSVPKAMPDRSPTGQPVMAQYEYMSPSERLKFGNLYGTQYRTIPTSPSMYRDYGSMLMPVYEAPVQSDWMKRRIAAGNNVRQVFDPIDVGGTPANLLRYESTYSHNGPPRGALADQTIERLNGMREGSDRERLMRYLKFYDPQKFAQYQTEMASGNGGSWGGGYRGRGGDRDIENEAQRRRWYDIQSRNYGRAGLPPPTILDIPRQTWEGTNPDGSPSEPPWGSGEAPYENYGRGVLNGFMLPFDYEPTSWWENRDGNDGGWGGRGRGGRGGRWSGRRPGWGGGRDRDRGGWGGRDRDRGRRYGRGTGG